MADEKAKASKAHTLKLAILFHNGEHFKMASTSTPRSQISIATRDFAAFQRTPTTPTNAIPACAAKTRVAIDLRVRGVEVLAIVKQAPVTDLCGGWLPCSRDFRRGGLFAVEI